MATTKTTANDVLIIGAGQAASELATALRQLKHTGAITMLGDEPYPPYRRPPLSKAYLSGQIEREALFIKQKAVYEAHDIECLTGVRVKSIVRSSRQVCLSSGDARHYGKLVLATGGRVRPLGIPGENLRRVHGIRTIEDIDSLRLAFEPGRRLVIIGGGYVGLEVAAVAAVAKLHVTVLESQSRVLARVTATPMSAYFEQLHRSHGVNVRTGVTVTGLAPHESDPSAVGGVLLADGLRLDADIVVFGIGLLPNVELAQAAGLQVDNGIVVDHLARTSDPDVLAIGDCCNHFNEFLGHQVRLESVPAAMEQARVAAATLCGQTRPRCAAPWFWSDQYDARLQSVGLQQGHDQWVLRGDMADNRFAAFYLRGGIVIAADVVSQPPEFMAAKRLVGERKAVNALVLSDRTVPLQSLF